MRRPANAVTSHDSRTLHYASGNGTNRPRRAWILSGGASEQPWDPEPRAFPWQALRQTAREERAKAIDEPDSRRP